jgi:hypothetical protein
MEESMSRHPIAAALILCALTTVTPFAAGGEAAASKTTRTPYQAYLAADCPDGSNFCRFVSEPVPDGSSLEIKRVACQGWHINTAPPSFVVMGELRTSANDFVSRIDFLEARTALANGSSIWTISENTLMFIPGGHRLRIMLNSGPTGVGSYGCTISGYMQTN